MSDTTETTDNKVEDAAPVVTPTPPTVTAEVVPAADVPAPVIPAVAAHDGASVGDDNIPGPQPVEAVVVSGETPAQVTGAPAVPVPTIQVFETSIELDHPITDLSHPAAVQVPDHGRGALDLPLHGVAGGRLVQDVFDEADAEAAKKDKE